MSGDDLFGGQGPRHQAGMPWDAQGRLMLRQFPRDWRGTGEDIRIQLLRRGLPKPATPNVWGGFIAGCIKRGLIEATGDREPMAGAKAHGRMTDVYCLGRKIAPLMQVVR